MKYARHTYAPDASSPLNTSSLHSDPVLLLSKAPVTQAVLPCSVQELFLDGVMCERELMFRVNLHRQYASSRPSNRALVVGLCCVWEQGRGHQGHIKGCIDCRKTLSRGAREPITITSAQDVLLICDCLSQRANVSPVIR